MSHEFLNEKEKKILDLEVRRNIYDAIKKYAGCHFREIERISRLSTGSVKYHLDYLARCGLIRKEKARSKLRYFPRDFDSKNKTLLGALRQQSLRNILLFILIHEGCNHEQIVKAVELSPSTVSWHLKMLEANNILGFDKRGRKTFYRILVDKNQIIKLLITYKESFLDTLVDRVVEMWDI